MISVRLFRFNAWDSPWLNVKFLLGGGIVLLILLIGLLGPLLWDTEMAYTGSAPLNLPPSWSEGGSFDHPLGTESNGRDMLAQLIVGTPSSLKIGFLAAIIGMLIGLVFGSVAGYMGGWWDHIIRTISDSAMTIPSLVVLIVIASYVQMTDTTTMALILALFAWPGPTRMIRSQILTLRERGYVRMAKLSGAPAWEIMFVEMAPNMLPWLAASLTGGISAAILAATGLEALGLGPTRVPSLGLIINQATTNAALVRGMIWWWLPPILILMVIFIGFFLMTIGLDEIANPRLRQFKASGHERGSKKTGPHPVSAPVPSADGEALPLDVHNLHVHYFTPRGEIIATNGVTFGVRKGEILGLVGESGCGKTTVAMAILQVVQSPGRIVQGEIKINGRDLIGLTEKALRNLRWLELALIPQGAMNALNPVTRIREQMGDAILAHESRGRIELEERILKLLSDVGLPDRVISMYPHELSGGMKQRVCIAMAIALNPDVIIADEPTSALDVVVQRVVAQTLLEVKDRLGVSMVMIGHDMGLLAQVVDRMAIMYAGNLVEIAPVAAAYEKPLHPYTQLLIESIPSIKARKPLNVTEGLTHDLRNPPPGCIFQYRCKFVEPGCRDQRPPLVEIEQDHFVACWLY
jgi:oligopeptide/dipeptide ABC transporter ATP-binding protein